MADLIAMLSAAAGAVGGEYEIERSLRFNSADSAYLSRTPASAGNRKTWTWSGWVKRSALNGSSSFTLLNAGATSGTNGFTYLIFFNDALRLGMIQTGIDKAVITNAIFRDTSAWYHIVCAVDTSLVSEAPRIKIYVNNVQQTFSSATYANQDFETLVNDTVQQRIGMYLDSGGNPDLYYNGYMTEIHFIDGQALTPSSFGEINADTGVWSPIRYTGTYGTNGFYLDFSDNTSTTTLGYDAAGSNDWTLNNFSVTAGAGNDSLVDSPTRYGTDTGAGGEVRGNYCTLNPLSTTTGTYSQGNLRFVGADSGKQSNGTISVSTGKWYWEVTLASAPFSPRASNSDWSSFGFSLATVFDGAFIVNSSNAVVLADNGYYKNFSGSATDAGTAFSSGDVLAVAVDLDNNTFTFYRNNSQLVTGTIGGTAGRELVPCQSSYSSAHGLMDCNFGQRPFAHTAPSGFKALVTTNLPDPTIVEGDNYFNTVLYTGTGSSLGVTGVGFQPDWVWIKERNGAADHGLYDAVRGVQQQLESNTTADETTEANGLTAFGTDGFTVGSLAQVNTSTDTYVAWNWKESTTSKFDIVTYTGNGSARTISHNLGVVPNMIIVKARTTASTDQGWPVYHSANTANPETDYLLLNSTAATADLDTVWNDTAPTSSVFSVGTNALVNANNDTYVAYLFAEVEGFSKFGSFVGNGSADGPFVYTGFRPAWILFKVALGLGGESWTIYDTKRGTYNVMGPTIFANLSNAEATNNSVDVLSNGFKLRSNSSALNYNTATMIFAAFAENPFKYSLAR